jgi:hypothetical protein
LWEDLENGQECLLSRVTALSLPDLAEIERQLAPPRVPPKHVDKRESITVKDQHIALIGEFQRISRQGWEEFIALQGGTVVDMRSDSLSICVFGGTSASGSDFHLQSIRQQVPEHIEIFSEDEFLVKAFPMKHSSSQVRHGTYDETIEKQRDSLHNDEIPPSYSAMTQTVNADPISTTKEILGKQISRRTNHNHVGALMTPIEVDTHTRTDPAEENPIKTIPMQRLDHRVLSEISNPMLLEQDTANRMSLSLSLLSSGLDNQKECVSSPDESSFQEESEDSEDAMAISSYPPLPFCYKTKPIHVEESHKDSDRSDKATPGQPDNRMTKLSPIPMFHNGIQSFLTQFKEKLFEVKDVEIFDKYSSNVQDELQEYEKLYQTWSVMFEHVKAKKQTPAKVAAATSYEVHLLAPKDVPANSLQLSRPLESAPTKSCPKQDRKRLSFDMTEKEPFELQSKPKMNRKSFQV